jgi:hypothetical protein
MVKQMPTEDELNAQIETEIAAGLAADRAKRRAELFYEARRKIAAADYDRINRRAPIEDKYGGLTPEQHAARLKAMDAAAAKTNAEMNAANARPIEGSLLDQRRRADAAGGSAGFRFKTPGGA